MENQITIREAFTENDEIPVTVEILRCPADRQLLKLENNFKK